MNVLHGCDTVCCHASKVTSYTPQFCVRNVLKRDDASVIAGSDPIFVRASRTVGFFAMASKSYLFALKSLFMAMTPSTIIVASFFNEFGASACNFSDKSVIFAHASAIWVGSVIAVGFSPCGPDMAALSFEDASQNVAYVGLTFPVVVGTTTEDAVDALLEPPHAAKRHREAMMIPAARERFTSFPGICPTYCGDLNG